MAQIVQHINPVMGVLNVASRKVRMPKGTVAGFMFMFAWISKFFVSIAVFLGISSPAVLPIPEPTPVISSEVISAVTTTPEVSIVVSPTPKTPESAYSQMLKKVNGTKDKFLGSTTIPTPTQLPQDTPTSTPQITSIPTPTPQIIYVPVPTPIIIYVTQTPVPTPNPTPTPFPVNTSTPTPTPIPMPTPTPLPLQPIEITYSIIPTSNPLIAEVINGSNHYKLMNLKLEFPTDYYQYRIEKLKVECFTEDDQPCPYEYYENYFDSIWAYVGEIVGVGVLSSDGTTIGLYSGVPDKQKLLSKPYVSIFGVVGPDSPPPSNKNFYIQISIIKLISLESSGWIPVVPSTIKTRLINTNEL